MKKARPVYEEMKKKAKELSTPERNTASAFRSASTTRTTTERTNPPATSSCSKTEAS
ncbi:MAG: hypothetical protein ACLUEQ_04095 [Cloacibacillus evryensis]